MHLYVMNQRNHCPDKQGLERVKIGGKIDRCINALFRIYRAKLKMLGIYSGQKNTLGIEGIGWADCKKWRES